MQSYRSIALGILAALVATLPALALSENRKETFILAEGKHPVAYQHAFVVPRDSDGDVYVCFGYANDGKFGEEGTFRGTATVTRFDPDTAESTVEKLRKRGGLRKNKWLRCVLTGPVHAGDSIVFDYEFSSFRKIRGATIHVRSSLGTDRMLIRELRGPEARGNLGSPTEFFHRVRTNEDGNGKHPKTWSQVFVIPTTSVAEKVEICFGYGNDFKKGNTGSFAADVKIMRTDPDTSEEVLQDFSVSAKVKDNRAKKCRTVDRFQAGDAVEILWTFDGMPKLRGRAFQVKTGIGPRVMADSEIFGPAPDRPEPSAGDPDVTPNPGGKISAADQIGASALLIKSRKTQLWRFKNNQPKHWTAIGPKTQLGSGLGGVNPATTGYGDTIAEAVADYERKMGKLPTGSGLSKAEVDALEWYNDMKTAGGPTSCRRDGGGGYHGEYYRPATGSVVVGGLNGIVGCINFFKSQGL